MSLELGASKTDIEYHYNEDPEFFKIWLGEKLSYTSARYHDWPSGSITTNNLDQAQERKHQYHFEALNLKQGECILDVGCGWGSFLNYSSQYNHVNGIGITLSSEQSHYCSGILPNNFTVYERSYTDYNPDGKIGGIVTMGSLEHFCRERMSYDEKIYVYKQYFERCADWLKTRGRISLQSVMWGENILDEKRETLLPLDVFPGTNPPSLSELVTASNNQFDVIYVEDGTNDYTLTCQAWLANIRRRRNEIIGMIGEHGFDHYEKYMRRSIAGFQRRRMLLVRVVFQKR